MKTAILAPVFGTLLAQAGAVSFDALKGWEWLLGVAGTTLVFLAKEWAAGRKASAAKDDLRQHAAYVEKLRDAEAAENQELRRVNDILDQKLRKYKGAHAAAVAQIIGSGAHVVKVNVPEASGVREINRRDSSSSTRRP